MPFLRRIRSPRRSSRPLACDCSSSARGSSKRRLAFNPATKRPPLGGADGLHLGAQASLSRVSDVRFFGAVSASAQPDWSSSLQLLNTDISRLGCRPTFIVSCQNHAMREKKNTRFYPRFNSRGRPYVMTASQCLTVRSTDICILHSGTVNKHRP